MEIKTSKEIELSNRQNQFDYTRWVSVKSIIKRIEKGMYDLHHDSSINCWEEVAEDMIRELEEE